jgi:hypothetical protein
MKPDEVKTSAAMRKREPDTASLRLHDCGQPAEDGEAYYQQ